MKSNIWFRSGLLLLLCALLCSLLVSCGTPAPEGPSVPAESDESVPVIEDENANLVRAYLDELLAQDHEDEEYYIHWLTPERAEAIRESVKQLNAPILTEGDVLRIAERAAFAVAAAVERPRMLEAPACGVLAGILWSSAMPFLSGEECYAALVAYTLYLFTPPGYVFREGEVWDSAVKSDPILYLPLTADYASRMEALAMLREGKNSVALPLSGFADEEHPLDCSRCGTPILFRESGELLMLDLLELAERANLTLPEEFLLARAEADVLNWFDRIVTGEELGVYGHHELPNGDDIGTYQLLTAEDVQEIREKVELLPAPILTEEMVYRLQPSLWEAADRSPLLLLPGFDGTEDLFLPPGIDSFEDLFWMNEHDITVKVNGATAYLLDLFTPSAYRFTDLYGRLGTYYILDGETEGYALVTEDYKRGEGVLLVEYAGGDVTEEEPME